MTITHDDFDSLLRYMINERNEGNEYVAYPATNSIISKEDLSCFNSSYDAAEFCYENSTDLDRFHYMAIRSVYRAMAEARQDSNLIVEKNGLIDIETMVNTRYNRLSPGKSIDNNQKRYIMNEKNLDYLGNQLKYTGFGEELQDKLKEALKSGQPSFTLTHQKDFGNDQTASTLHFRKSDESDLYFFNRYTLILKNNQHPDPVQQTFYINAKTDNITLKEAYNLMAGRAVHKELTDKNNVEYKAWLQIDFKNTDENGNYRMKQYHQNYGYDLNAVLAKHPIKELGNDEHRARLLESLERGNRQSVTVVIGGHDQKLSIEAVPQFKSLNFYDASGQRLRSDKLYENNSQEQSVKKEVKQSAKASGDEEEGPGEGQQKNRKRSQKIS